jgi:hypothetical protein
VHGWWLGGGGGRGGGGRRGSRALGARALTERASHAHGMARVCMDAHAAVWKLSLAPRPAFFRLAHVRLVSVRQCASAALLMASTTSCRTPLIDSTAGPLVLRGVEGGARVSLRATRQLRARRPQCCTIGRAGAANSRGGGADDAGRRPGRRAARQAGRQRLRAQLHHGGVRLEGPQAVLPSTGLLRCGCGLTPTPEETWGCSRVRFPVASGLALSASLTTFEPPPNVSSYSGLYPCSWTHSGRARELPASSHGIRWPAVPPPPLEPASQPLVLAQCIGWITCWGRRSLYARQEGRHVCLHPHTLIRLDFICYDFPFAESPGHPPSRSLV